MEISANHINIEQLIALIEARQFPIGVDFIDPLANRLYDAMSVLMAQASVTARQTRIARRYINTAMSEMGNNQGGYYHLKKCLEEMNAQEQGETAAVVLCQQYQEELNELIPAAKVAIAHLHEAATGLESVLPAIATSTTLAAYVDDLEQQGAAAVLLLRDSAALLELMLKRAPDFNASNMLNRERHLYAGDWPSFPEDGGRDANA